MNLFTLNNVKKNYGTQCAFHCENLEIEHNNLIAFIGNSGSGKTTLLHLLANIIIPTTGELYYHDQEITKYKAKERECYLRECVDVIFQEYNLIESLNVIENLTYLKTINTKLNDADINSMLVTLGIAEIKNRHINEISGGQAQRVAIARSLLKATDVILADEPTGALDIENTHKVMQLFKEASKQKTVLYVTHDLNCALYAQTIYIIEDGQVVRKITNNVQQETEKQLEHYFTNGGGNE